MHDKIKFDETSSFMKCFKKLFKKYPSLKEDFELFKKALKEDGTNLTGVVQISGLGKKVLVPFYKAKKFRCKSLNAGNKSGIRVVFCWRHESEDAKVSFIEIYPKNKQENHDKEKIIKFCKENEFYAN